MGKREDSASTASLKSMGCLLLGGAAAFGVSLLCLLLAAVGISGGWISETAMEALSIAACVLGAVVGGVLAAIQRKEHGVASGAMVGGILFLLIVTVGSLLFPGFSLSQGGIGRGIGCLCGGALSGLPSFSRKKPAKRRHRAVRNG